MHSYPPETPVFTVVLQRDAFGPRLVARAADVWRAMQDVVVDHSSAVGWTPERYEAENRMFVVRTMTVRHERPVRINESMKGRTWVSRARRDMLFTREVRLFSSRDDALVSTATQEWALLSRTLEPTRASADMYAAFAIVKGHPSTQLPTFEPVARSAQVHHFSFRTWHQWMDPHGHVNHASYVDYCDESTNRLLARHGFDAQNLSAHAEEVHFRAAIGADVEVNVETTLAGRERDRAVFTHRITTGSTLCATATTVRGLVNTSADWVRALEASSA